MSTSFKYTYQRILEIKEKEKENAQQQMARAIQREEQAEDHLTSLTVELDYAHAQLEEKQGKCMITELQMIEDYVDHLRRRLRFQQAELSSAKEEVDKKQDVLQARLKEEKIWVTLKEKQAQYFHQHLKAQEQAQLDEVAISMFFRSPGKRSEKIEGTEKKH